MKFIVFQSNGEKRKTPNTTIKNEWNLQLFRDLVWFKVPTFVRVSLLHHSMSHYNWQSVVRIPFFWVAIANFSRERFGKAQEMCICNWCSDVEVCLVSRCFWVPKLRSKMNPFAICHYSHIPMNVMYAFPFGLPLSGWLPICRPHIHYTHIKHSTIFTFPFFFFFSMKEFCTLAQIQFQICKIETTFYSLNMWFLDRNSKYTPYSIQSVEKYPYCTLYHYRLCSMLLYYKIEYNSNVHSAQNARRVNL